MTALTAHGRSFNLRARPGQAGGFGHQRPAIGVLEKNRLGLVLEQAQRAGIIGSVTDILHDARMIALVARHFQVPQPSLDACRRYYRDHEDEFRAPDRHVGRQIVLRYPAGEDALRAEAMARAERLIAILFFDPRMFDDLLASYDSLQDGTGSGRIGPAGPGDLPAALEAALFALRPGQICPTPVITETGVHVLLLDRIFAGHLPSFEAVQDRISAQLRKQFRRAAAARHLARLAERYEAGRDQD